MRKISFVLLLVVVIFCSCSITNIKNEETVIETSSNDYNTISIETVETTENTDEFLVDDYIITPIQIDSSFDELIDYWAETLQITNPKTINYTYDNSQMYNIIYIPSYSEYLESVNEYEEANGIRTVLPEEHETHITEFFCVQGLRLEVYHYDSVDRAEEKLTADINAANLNEHVNTIYNHIEDGFFCYTKINCLQIEYIINDFIVIYYYTSGAMTIEDFNHFVDFCTEYNLPLDEEWGGNVLF